MAAMALAIAGAFAAQSAKKVVSPKTGWINTPTACFQSRSCDTTPGTVCTITVNGISYQAYGKADPDVLTCAQVLYKPAL